MNMDYREPRNGDFASYVEELSRHFDMKEQAVNPDFSSGFPSQLTGDAALRSGKPPASGASSASGYGSLAGKTASGGNSPSTRPGSSSPSTDTGFPVPASGAQHTGFQTRPAGATKVKARSFPTALVVGLIAVVVFILSDAFGPDGDGLRADTIRGPLIFILVILFIIYRRIRNAAKRFPIPSKTTKQT